MAGVNKVIVVGNLGKDPEVRYTPSGAAVANFPLAVSESWTDKQGQRQDRTEWFRVVVWNKPAELCGEYLAKGRQVYIEGKLQTREWTDRDNNKRYTTEVIANQVTFLGTRGEAGANGTSSVNKRSNNSMTPSDMAGSEGGGGSGNNQGGQGQGGSGGYDFGPPPNEDDVPF